MTIPLMSKRRYWAVLNRTIKSYPKDVLLTVFEQGRSVIAIEKRGDLQISLNWGSRGKYAIKLFDWNRTDGTRRYRLLPDSIRTHWPTLPLWEKAIRDAIKKRLIDMSLS